MLPFSKEIKIIDLPALHAPIKKELDSAISQVLTHQQFINGPELTAFESQLGNYLNAQVLGVGNGTDALEIALLALDIKPGDEVLVPSFSYFASAEAVAHLGAVPVFVDIDPRTYIIDIEDAALKITSKTKAIIVVHLYGLSADMELILGFAKANNIKIIEDTAQAIGAECEVNGEWKKAGTIGDIGCVSFFPSKNLGAFGDGGAIISTDENSVEKAKKIAQHGQSKRYSHDFVGMNSRLDTLQAAVLIVKLKQLDYWTKRRQEIANRYTDKLKNIDGVQPPYVPQNCSHVYHQYTIYVASNRDAWLHKLQALGVPARLYYPKSIHQQKAFQKISPVSLPVTEQIQSGMLSLPIHPTMTNEEVDYIIESMR